MLAHTMKLTYLYGRQQVLKTTYTMKLCQNYAPINVKPAGGGQGMGWGGDLIVFVVPGVGHLNDLVLPGEGIFESFFARRRDI